MELIERLKGRVDKGEVFCYKGTSRDISFKGWKIRSSESNQQRGYGVRVFVDGKLGTAATTDPEVLDKIIDDAITAAKYGEKLDIQFPGPAEFISPDIFDSKTTNFGLSKMAEIGEEIMSRLEEYRSEADCEISLSTAESHVKIANTEGFQGEYRKTGFSVSGFLVRVKEGDIFFAGESWHTTYLPESEEVISKIINKINKTMKFRDIIVPSPSGKIPVVFTPEGSYVLFLPLSLGVNGNNIYTKTSPIFDKLNRKLFDEKLTIINDGTLDGRPGSSPFDAEGIPQSLFPVVENGVLRNFLFDLKTAAKSGYKSNGCARRGIFTPPTPTFANIIIKEGDSSLEDILSDIKEGIMVESVLGLGQGNVLSGAFSNPITTGYKIEKGKIVGRIKNSAIAGNIYECLTKINSISKDAEWVRGAYHAPYIRLDDISVVSK